MPEKTFDEAELRLPGAQPVERIELTLQSGTELVDFIVRELAAEVLLQPLHLGPAHHAPTSHCSLRQLTSA